MHTMGGKGVRRKRHVKSTFLSKNLEPLLGMREGKGKRIVKGGGKGKYSRGKYYGGRAIFLGKQEGHS